MSLSLASLILPLLIITKILLHSYPSHTAIIPKESPIIPISIAIIAVIKPFVPRGWVV